MNGFRQTRTWLMLAVLGASPLLLQRLPAQQATNSVPPRHFMKSPVAFFRELLAMTPDEQEMALAIRSPEHRKGIEAKIAEYTALDANERELRLQATELHWYLLPLLKMPEAERAQRLERIPPEMRKLVEQRLEIWTILPPPLAQEVLDNEPVARIFVLSRKATPADLKEVLQDMPPSRRRELEAGIARWQEMPEHQRSQICSQFSQFFDLTPEEKERALDTLSDAERRQMEKTLQEFEKLPKNQRELCIQSFQKFAGMSLAERELFLKNAKRWNEMLPTERQLWRELVVQVPNYPPPPPGF